MTSLTRAGKTPNQKSTTTKKPTVKARRTLRKKNFLKDLPKNAQHLEIVQQMTGVFEELQKRVLDVKAEAKKELKKLMNIYEANYNGIEKKVHQVTSEAKKQAQTSMMQVLQKWHEHKDKLPSKVAREIEKILEQIGTKMAGTGTEEKLSGKTTTAKRSRKKTAAKTDGNAKKLIPKPVKNDSDERVHKL